MKEITKQRWCMVGRGIKKTWAIIGWIVGGTLFVLYWLIRIMDTTAPTVRTQGWKDAEGHYNR